MAEQSSSSAEWLPPGWTVEIKVRKNGKKDRCFIDPSKEHKFNSKPEVLRYLKSRNSIPESEGKRRSRNRPSLDSPAVAGRVHVEDSGTNEQKITNQTSEPVKTLKDKKILELCAGGETSVLDQKEKNKFNNGDSAILPDASPKSMPEMEENGNKSLQINNNNKSKNNDKKRDLPRRSSKRLAGFEVDPMSELSPNNRTRRISARLVDDTDAATAESSLHNTEAISAEDDKHDFPQIYNTKAISAEDINHDNPQIHSTEAISAEDIKHDCPRIHNTKAISAANTQHDYPQIHNSEAISTEENKHDCPSEGCFMPKEHQLQIETSNNKSDDMACSSVEVPLEDFWMDPCIEFAIKTLTGQIPIEEELGKSKNPTNSQEPSTESPSLDLWGDPCIEFAVRTLTGDIPFDGFSFQNQLQKRGIGSDFGLGSGTVSNPDGSCRM